MRIDAVHTIVPGRADSLDHAFYLALARDGARVCVEALNAVALRFVIECKFFTGKVLDVDGGMNMSAPIKREVIEGLCCEAH